MRVLGIKLENVGPFDEASLEFLATPAATPAVTLITGENGTGKTILLDAIRMAFGPAFGKVERTIWRPSQSSRIQLSYAMDGQTSEQTLEHTKRGGDLFSGSWTTFQGERISLGDYPSQAEAGQAPNWLVDYWRSTQLTDGYDIKTLVKPEPRYYLRASLSGIQRNAQVTELLCYFDYLRDSRNTQERKTGEALYSAAERIIQSSLLNGEFLGVERATFTPKVRQAGQEVPLANVSSGNAYLIQRMITLLGKMYAVHVLRRTPAEDLCTTPGLLLIDEAENHFHPRWQKRFLKEILSVFPNLQIIATTHSPFILASVPSARVYVCRWDQKRCTVAEETEAYANKPVDEILLSGAFDGTLPFGKEISDLLEKRRLAIASSDEPMRRQVEEQLLEKNPEYFSYLRIEEKLRALEGAA